MRTTVEMPDDLMVRAKERARADQVSLREFLIQAVSHELAPASRKVRRAPPVIGRAGAPPIDVLTSEQIDEALFG